MVPQTDLPAGSKSTIVAINRSAEDGLNRR
jgi:hypothetical protein